MEKLDNFSKKERKLLRRQEGKRQEGKNRQKRKIKKLLNYSLITLVAGGAIFGVSWWIFQQEPISESDIISRQGIHWHSDLSVKILGQYQDIPANIGLGVTERYIHTHDSDGVIHMEFPRLVRKEDIRLSQFFNIWGKEFNEDCIFDRCSGLDGKVKMFVNGEPNYEFENYIMQDKDKIEIVFE